MGGSSLCSVTQDYLLSRWKQDVSHSASCSFVTAGDLAECEAGRGGVNLLSGLSFPGGMESTSSLIPALEIQRDSPLPVTSPMCIWPEEVTVTMDDPFPQVLSSRGHIHAILSDASFSSFFLPGTA